MVLNRIGSISGVLANWTLPPKKCVHPSVIDLAKNGGQRVYGFQIVLLNFQYVNAFKNHILPGENPLDGVKISKRESPCKASI